MKMETMKDAFMKAFGMTDEQIAETHEREYNREKARKDALTEKMRAIVSAMNEEHERSVKEYLEKKGASK